VVKKIYLSVCADSVEGDESFWTALCETLATPEKDVVAASETRFEVELTSLKLKFPDYSRAMRIFKEKSAGT
jgi:hypothetical protein